MSENIYLRTMTAVGYDLGDDVFAKAIREALPGHAISVICSDAECIVRAQPDLSAAEVTALDAIVMEVSTLGRLKEKRFREIDARTGQLIDEGFEFPPGSGQRFSLSTKAQNTLIGMKTLLGNGILTFPLEWNTIDDTGLYQVPDQATAEQFYLTAVGTVRGHLDSGTPIKTQIRNATTEAEVLTVQDLR